MSDRDFMEMLRARWAKGTAVCVGLDSDYRTIIKDSPTSTSPDPHVRWPSVEATVVNFNREIVEATKDLVCAYKPNIAFYEAHGREGIAALHRTIVDIHVIAPDVPVILDAKRADIGNTNNGYVEMAFNFLRVDAITVHPYLGQEALKPFLDRKDKGIIVLCRTSNPGAGEFQDKNIPVVPGGYLQLYEYVAHRVAQHWNENGNCAVVVGATYPEELGRVRKIVGDMPILIPGVGKQGGDVTAVVKNGADSKGEGMIVNSSSAIIFASSGPDFADAARRGIRLRDLFGRESETVNIPVIASAGCDNAMVFAQRNFGDYICVARELLQGLKVDNVVCVKAVGDSMVDAGIKEGDYVLVEVTEAVNPNDLVVAIIDSFAVIKKIEFANNAVVLKPVSSDPQYKPIILKRDFRIFGKVIDVIRMQSKGELEIVPLYTNPEEPRMEYKVI